MLIVVAPVDIIEAQLKDVVQNLYNLIVQPFDHQGSQTQDAMKREMYDAYVWCSKVRSIEIHH